MSAQPGPKFKIDENAPAEFARMLSAAGYDAEHALEEALGGASDHVLAAAAREERRAIVTLDLGFADVRLFPPSEYAGLIVLRLDAPNRTRLIEVFGRLVELLRSEPIDRRLWIVDDRGVRVRE